METKNKKPIRIIELVQTCSACPTQYEGRTDDNRPVYIRYRWGHLKVEMGPVGGDIDSAVFGESVFSCDLGDDLDGLMNFEELKNATKGFVEFDVKEIPEKTRFYLIDFKDGTSKESENLEDLLDIVPKKEDNK